MHHVLPHCALRAFKLRGSRPARWSIMVTSALALAALGVLSGTPGAHAAVLANTGEIDGTLINGTAGNTPLAGQTVTLLRQSGADVSQMGTSVTNARGLFQSRVLPPTRLTSMPRPSPTRALRTPPMRSP